VAPSLLPTSSLLSVPPTKITGSAPNFLAKATAKSPNGPGPWTSTASPLLGGLREKACAAVAPEQEAGTRTAGSRSSGTWKMSVLGSRITYCE